MRSAGKIGLGLFALGCLLASGGPKADPAVEACATDPKVLGLSRIVEIDTENGPQFGSTHKSNDFLRDHEVVLTFDDGPLRPYTRAVLKALAAHCTKATFFMVGRMAAADPLMVKEVSAAGHTVGSHTWSHMNLSLISLFKSRQEFELGLSAVTKAHGSPIAPFFRFPYLRENRLAVAHARSRHIGMFGIDVDSKDYLTRDPKEVHQRVMSQLAVTKKGIILFHDIQPSTVRAIKGLLDDLHDKGFKVVHMVPKARAETIAVFDGAAAKAIAAKAAAAAQNPMANRSVLWTMGKSDAASPNGGAANTASTADAPDSESLPWLTPDSKKAPETGAGAKRTARPKTEDSPWKLNIFQY